jgi:hypothetical protein
MAAWNAWRDENPDVPPDLFEASLRGANLFEAQLGEADLRRAKVYCARSDMENALRKLKGHGLIERDGSRYAYRLTTKGVQVALLFLFFHNGSADRSPTAASTTARILPSK